MPRAAARVGSVIGNPKMRATGLNPFAEDPWQDAHAQMEGAPFVLQTAEDLRIQSSSNVLREGSLDKRIDVKEIRWVKRHVTLTSDAILFATEAGGEIRESINLSDISSCRPTNAADHMSRSSFFESNIGESSKRFGMETEKKDSQPFSADKDWLHSISIHTERFGRTYYLRADRDQLKHEWIQAINDAREEKKRDEILRMRKSKIRTFKEKLRVIYNSSCVQNSIASLIVVNFILIVYEAQSNYPPEHEITQALDATATAFTVMYTVEIVVNMYVHWFKQFFTNSWCLFDFVVVLLSIVESIFSALSSSDGSNLSILRLLRVFRVVRLFNKFKSLQKVILGISSTLVPMSNIMLVYIVITSIYAVLATNLYSESSPPKFGSFSLSLYSMFQVATGDSWATDVVRTLCDDPENTDSNVILFFVSYVIAVGIILFNIIVAVLLEGFLGAIQQQDREERERNEYLAMQRDAGALDPLLATLVNFSSPQHLSSQIGVLFQLMDADDSGTLSLSEVQNGLQSLPLNPPVVLSIEDWDSLTMDRSILDKDNMLTYQAFQTAIRWQLMLYGQRLLAQRMQQAIRTKSDDPTTLFAMKLCLMQVCNQCSPPAQANLVGYGFSCPAQKTPSLKPKEPIPDSPSTDAEVWNVERWPSVQGVDRKLETLIEMVKDGHRRSGEAMAAAREACKLSQGILDHLQGSPPVERRYSKKTLYRSDPPLSEQPPLGAGSKTFQDSGHVGRVVTPALSHEDILASSKNQDIDCYDGMPEVNWRQSYFNGLYGYRPAKSLFEENELNGTFSSAHSTAFSARKSARVSRDHEKDLSSRGGEV